MHSAKSNELSSSVEIIPLKEMQIDVKDYVIY